MEVRVATPDDLPAVIDVCRSALGWDDDDDNDVNARFFTWKHVDNPFGRSPIWVAIAEGRIVGVRAMMRWEMERPATASERQPQRQRLARAVDTATLPEYQGQGIFTKLTMAAVDELAADGVGAIFNTPNDKSRPGYLKMGWETLGRVPVVVRPRSPRTLAAMARSRTAADRWGLPTDAGLPPGTAFADPAPVEQALAASYRPPTDQSKAKWLTPLSVEYLRWRTGFEPLACRVEPLGQSIADGFIVFRIRQRGALRQLSLLHVASPSGAGPVRRAVRSLLRATGADLAMASGPSLGLLAGMVPLPRAGPLLTWRTLASPAAPATPDLDLPLGTIELF